MERSEMSRSKTERIDLIMELAPIWKRGKIKRDCGRSEGVGKESIVKLYSCFSRARGAY
jgi:hypothetical protein